MKQIASILVALLIAHSTAAAGQHDPPPRSPLPSDEELQQLGDMAQRWMRSFADKMTPMVEQLQDMVDDLNAYQAPEMLPNGDIIIRRKPDAPRPQETAPSVEL